MVKEEKKKKGTKMKTAFPGLMVSDRVELRDVRLISAKCSQTPEAAHGKKTYKIDHSVKVQTDEKNGYIIVVPEFHFEAFGENKTKEPVIVIDASFILAYKIDNFQGLTQEGFEQFAKLNGIYNAWPYWREFVQNTIIRMGLPSLSIPVFRIVKPSKEKSIKKNGRKKVLAEETSAKT